MSLYEDIETLRVIARIEDEEVLEPAGAEPLFMAALGRIEAVVPKMVSLVKAGVATHGEICTNPQCEFLVMARRTLDEIDWRRS